MGSTKRSPGRSRRWSIHSTRLQLVMYSLLLVATPFVLLRRFLQEAIGSITRYPIELGGRQFPLVPVIALVLLAAAMLAFRRRLTRRILGVSALAMLMVFVGHRIADYYLMHKWYDLQQNWHYIAYGLFAYMAWRDFRGRGMSRARTILITYAAAILYSSFDEAFQHFISSRVFDMGDIAKDGWGAVIGMTVLNLGEREPGNLLDRRPSIRQRRPGGYLSEPASMLAIVTLLNFLLLIFGSLQSDARYAGDVLLWTIGAFVPAVLVLHLSQFRPWRRGLIALGLAALAVLALLAVLHRDEPLREIRPGLLLYRGLPVVHFDLMVRPDGSFRLVDKKEFFTLRDRQCLMSQGDDIILVASGSTGSGGRGFPETGVSQFNFNPSTQGATQVIILSNDLAVPTYNRLISEDKHVLLVYHNGK